VGLAIAYFEARHGAAPLSQSMLCERSASSDALTRRARRSFILLAMTNATHRSPFAPLPFRVRAELFTQLEKMETAGLPADRAFSILQVSGEAKPRLATMRGLMKSHDIATAGLRSGLFTMLESRLIQASTIAGSPARVYRRLADYYTARAMQLSTMRAQMMTPICVFLLALIIAPLPSLVGGSIGFIGYLWAVLYPILVIVALGFGVRWWLKNRAKESSIVMAIPIYGALVVRQNVRDFFESLALMLEAGVSMLEALPLALDTIEEPGVRREFARVGPRVREGATLAHAIADSRYLGSAQSRERLVSFVNTGEQSGTLPEMLLRHAAMETSEINGWYEQLAIWAPRIVYGMVMVWMIVSLLSGPGFLPRVPADL
jgi:general secretion pathway protein F